MALYKYCIIIIIIIKVNHLGFRNIQSSTQDKYKATDPASQPHQKRIEYTVKHKTCHKTFVRIFAKYRPIIKVLSLANFVENLQ